MVWIRTQDRKQLLTKIIKLSVSKNFGSKQKAVIMAEYESNSLFGNPQIAIGQFLTESAALEELTHIEKFIDGKESGIYQVK